MKVEARITELGLQLPVAPRPVANYVRVMRTGNLLFVSGHGPYRDGRLQFVGKVGRDITPEEGYEAAKLVALNCLASAKEALGDLDRVRRVVKLLGMVNATPEFEGHPEVINGASDVLVQIFGEAGRHARSAVGMASLPRNISVEVEMVLEIE